MSAVLDLSQSIEARSRQSADALKARIEQVLDVGRDQIEFAQKPEEALGKVLRLDVLTSSSVTLPIQMGLPELGFFIQVYDKPNRSTTDDYQPSLMQSQAVLDKLTPAALSEINQLSSERSSLCLAIGQFILDQTGMEHDITSDGLVMPNSEPNQQALGRLGLIAETRDKGLILHMPDLETVKEVVRHLGVSATGRRATVRRTTKETDITVSINLDGDGASVSTGVHFFDHMLEQIAKHGDIQLNVICVGDVEVDAHHTIEDVCLALGDALRQALGDKRGIGRYGFALPMDETRASAWIDLSGRPFFRFDGEIPGERVGDYPVEMAAHAFRSISETLKAAIHIEVDGENAHHMIEASFKAFARALRQAVVIEGDDLPSTKGAL